MKRIVLCLGVLALAGCSMLHKGDAASYGCPAMGLVKGAGFAPVIAGGKPHSADADLAASARIQSLQGGCKTRSDGVEVKLILNFVGHRGPQGGKVEEHTFPYFVAVISPEGRVLQRNVFSTTVSFDNATGAGTSSEDHKIRVPLKDYSTSSSYQIAAGFALNAQQATYNKENHAD